MSPSRIETLEEGTFSMGNLEKVGWVFLKSGYNITPYCDLENELYHLNNDFVKYKKNGLKMMVNINKCSKKNQRIFMIQDSLTMICLKFMNYYKVIVIS